MNEQAKCVDCGAALDDGTAKVFTVCDDCWDKAYAKVPAAPLDMNQDLRAEVTRLRAALAAVSEERDRALQDTERLDWVQAHGEHVDWIDPDSDSYECMLAYSLTGDEDRIVSVAVQTTLRQAIDDARKSAAAVSVVEEPNGR